MREVESIPLPLSAGDDDTVFSDCGRYRYRLKRYSPINIGMMEALKIEPKRDACIFVMLNPSTADAKKDDPTIRKCKAFSFQWGYATLWVVNMFAYRSPYPKMLLEPADPVGPDNDRHIGELLQDNRDALLVCAWGRSIPKKLHWRQDEFIARHLHGRETYCLGRNMDGTPVHPLYRAYETPLVPFPGESNAN